MQGRFARTLFCRCRARAPLAVQIIGNRCGCPTIILAIQSDSIRPFSPLFHETGTDRVFLNVKPFLVQGFARPQKTIERAWLPFPGCAKFLTYPALQRFSATVL